MGQAVSNFFTTTVVEVAKKAWTAVVDGVNTFAKLLEKEAKSFVTTVINGIDTIVTKVKNFFINSWHNVEEFTHKIFNLKSNLKDYMWTQAYEIGKGFHNSEIDYMRGRLNQMSFEGIDSLTDDQVSEKWHKYMNGNPLKPEDKNELNEMLDSSSDPSNKVISGTGGYSKLRSLPSTDIVATNHRKDHAITHVTVVLLCPKMLTPGLQMLPFLAPDEEEDLHRSLSFSEDEGGMAPYEMGPYETAVCL
ncbi:hypothetical protein SUGI_0891140 [Cryptomeria japonica]|nr:hypothetical protein SUGI_0891140 [Cryptomeria japonica]